MRGGKGRGRREESAGLSASPLSRSRLRFEGPRAALSNRWRGVFVCMCGGVQLVVA